MNEWIIGSHLRHIWFQGPLFIYLTPWFVGLSQSIALCTNNEAIEVVISLSALSLSDKTLVRHKVNKMYVTGGYCDTHMLFTYLIIPAILNLQKWICCYGEKHVPSDVIKQTWMHAHARTHARTYAHTGTHLPSTTTNKTKLKGLHPPISTLCTSF